MGSMLCNLGGRVEEEEKERRSERDSTRVFMGSMLCDLGGRVEEEEKEKRSERRGQNTTWYNVMNNEIERRKQTTLPPPHWE